MLQLLYCSVLVVYNSMIERARYEAVPLSRGTAVCRHPVAVAGVTFDCESVYKLREPLDACPGLPLLSPEATAFIAPVCARVGAGLELLVELGGSTGDRPRLLSQRSFLKQDFAISAAIATRRRIVAFTEELSELVLPPGINVMQNGSARKNVWSTTGNNAGNELWIMGALGLMDTESTIVRHPLALLQVDCCRPVAFIMPMANLLRPYSRGQKAPILRGKDGRLTTYYTKVVEWLNVPTMIVGIGLQMELPEKVARTNVASEDATPDLNVSNLVLLNDQVQMLRAVGRRTRKGVANIAMRGDASLQACLNSRVSNCVSLGCPSLMLSSDTALGAVLHAKWAALREQLLGARSARHLRIVFGMPATWSEQLAQLFVAAGREFPHFLIVLQQEKDVDGVRRLRELGLPVHDEQVRLFPTVPQWIATLAQCDVVLSGRIHGSLAAMAASVPSIAVATDMRMHELATRMRVPTVQATHLAPNLNLSVFINRYVRFDGVAFDDNRAAIAEKYVSTLGALGVPVSQRVVRIATGRSEPPARGTPSLIAQKTSGFQRLLDGRGSKDFWRPSAT